MVTIDVKTLYGDQARLFLLPEYITQAKSLAGQGNDVILTGPGPVWLYLKIAHALHGIAKSLAYALPVTGIVVIFNHDLE